MVRGFDAGSQSTPSASPPDGIYLWQQLFTAPAKTYTPLGTPIGYMLPLLFAIIPLSYLFIEKPAMRFGRFLADRVRPQTTRA